MMSYPVAAADGLSSVVSVARQVTGAAAEHSRSAAEGLRTVKVFASIRGRPTWITGWPHSGWRGADPNEEGAKQLAFGFDVTDDGSGNFLLVYYSADGAYEADTWHESQAEAYSSAEARFGVRRSEWGPPQDAEQNAAADGGS
jgi:hypothetical protein